MSLYSGDKVRIKNKNNIEGVIIGFYSHTMDAVVRTAQGNEWIVNPVHLEKIINTGKKQ